MDEKGRTSGINTLMQSAVPARCTNFQCSLDRSFLLGLGLGLREQHFEMVLINLLALCVVAKINPTTKLRINLQHWS